MTFIVMGPGTTPTTAENIANSKVPVWFFTSTDDTTKYPLPDVTRNLYKDVKAKGGHAWLTEWKSGGHLVQNRVCGAWYTPAGQPGHGIIATPENALGMNDPKLPLYSWMLNNRRGGPVHSPAEPLQRKRRR